MAEDIIRWMNEKKLTMATIGGHGFGAKLATAVATRNLNRFTGVVLVDGGPVDNRWHEAYRELCLYVKQAKFMKLEKLDVAALPKKLRRAIPCKMWNKIFN